MSDYDDERYFPTIRVPLNDAEISKDDMMEIVRELVPLAGTNGVNLLIEPRRIYDEAAIEREMQRQQKYNNYAYNPYAQYPYKPYGVYPYNPNCLNNKVAWNGTALVPVVEDSNNVTNTNAVEPVNPEQSTDNWSKCNCESKCECIEEKDLHKDDPVDYKCKCCQCNTCDFTKDHSECFMRSIKCDLCKQSVFHPVTDCDLIRNFKPRISELDAILEKAKWKFRDLLVRTTMTTNASSGICNITVRFNDNQEADFEISLFYNVYDNIWKYQIPSRKELATAFLSFAHGTDEHEYITYILTEISNKMTPYTIGKTYFDFLHDRGLLSA